MGFGFGFGMGMGMGMGSGEGMGEGSQTYGMGSGRGGRSQDHHYSDSGQIPTGGEVDGKGETYATGITGQRRAVPGEEAYLEVRGPTKTGLRSSVPYRKVLPSYRKKADEALDRQQIPPEHQKRVRKYFEALGG